MDYQLEWTLISCAILLAGLGIISLLCWCLVERNPPIIENLLVVEGEILPRYDQV
jgi:hypothetical protein